MGFKVAKKFLYHLIHCKSRRWTIIQEKVALCLLCCFLLKIFIQTYYLLMKGKWWKNTYMHKHNNKYIVTTVSQRRYSNSVTSLFNIKPNRKFKPEPAFCLKELIIPCESISNPPVHKQLTQLVLLVVKG